MFSAINQNGQFYSLLGKSREEIIEVRERTFYCPVCNQKLLLKIGEVNQPHFSHIKHSDCPVESEPESEQHITGKLQLQILFQKLGWKADLEVYLQTISQKPDLLIEKDSQRIAIEYQCSPLSLYRLQKRVNGYRKLGIQQKWFFAPNLIKAQPSFNYINLSDIVLSCLNWNVSHFRVWSLDPAKRSLILFHHILPFSQRKIFVLQSRYSLLEIQPRHATPSIKSIIQNWKQARISWLLAPNSSKKQSDQQFYRFLYQKSVHKSLLPPFIGIPHFSLPFVKTPAPIWQAYVCLELYQLLQRQSAVPREQLNQILKKRLQSGEIELRDFLFQPASLEIPVREYLQILIALDVFAEKKNHILMGKEMHTMIYTAITQDQSIRNQQTFYRDNMSGFLSYLDDKNISHF